MKTDRDDTRNISLVLNLASLLVSLVSLMVSMHLGGYVIVALFSAGIGAGLAAAALISR